MLMNRTWTALTFLTSCCIYGRAISGARLLFLPPYIFKLPVPEIWRIFTPFFITGPDWAILYDTYFRQPSLTHETKHSLTVCSLDVFKQSRAGII